MIRSHGDRRDCPPAGPGRAAARAGAGLGCRGRRLLVSSLFWSSVIPGAAAGRGARPPGSLQFDCRAARTHARAQARQAARPSPGPGLGFGAGL